MSKTQYEYRRDALDPDRKPHARFSDGDLLAYRVASRFIDKCRCKLSWLRKNDWSFVFDVCNKVSFESLAQCKFFFDVESHSLLFVGPGEKEPEIDDPYDMAEADMNKMIEAHFEALRSGYQRKVVKITADEFLLAQSRRKLASNAVPKAS